MGYSHRTVVIIEEPKRNPYELWVLWALAISGLLFLLGLTPKPNSLQQTLPNLNVLLWNIQIFSGSAVALLGMYWKRATTGKLIQIVGHLWTAAGALVYAGALYYYNGTQATMAGLIVGGIAVAAGTKVLQLRQQLNMILKKVGERNGDNPMDPINGGDRSTA